MISEDTDREVVSEEGYFASLDCVVIRGSPTPLVSWWRGNELVSAFQDLKMHKIFSIVTPI